MNRDWIFQDFLSLKEFDRMAFSKEYIIKYIPFNLEKSEPLPKYTDPTEMRK